MGFQNDIVGESALFPCSVCGRTFSKSSLERHARVCEKVKSTPKRKVFNVEKLGGDLKVSYTFDIAAINKRMFTEVNISK